MRKTVSPTVTIVVIVIVVLIFGWFFVKKVKGGRKVVMTRQGPVDARTGELLGEAPSRPGGGGGAPAAGGGRPGRGGGEEQQGEARRAGP